MEKLPTIILPEGDVASPSPRAAGSLGSLEKVHVSSKSSLLRLGGIRLRCENPQQLVDEFYVKRLGMQELLLGCAQRPRSLSKSRTDLGATGEGEDRGGNGSEKLSQEGQEPLAPSGASSRRNSFGSQKSARNNSLTSAVPSSPNRFAAFEFFSPAELEGAVAEAADAPAYPTAASIKPKSWLRHGGGQFVLEFVPVQKARGGCKAYEHRGSDVFSHLSFTVCDVDTMAVDLSQHMVRVEPAGQFLDMAYAAGFTDPQNFRGRLLQYMSEYKMASLKAHLSDELRAASSCSLDQFHQSPPRGCDSGERKRLAGVAAESCRGEGAGRHRSPSPSPPSSFCSLSVPGSGASSFLSSERDGCLPAPTPEEVKAVELCHSSSSVRFDTLPLLRLPVLHHIEIAAANLEETLKFYEDVLGMTLIDKKTAGGFGFTLYFLALESPTNTSFHYWLWLQRFSSICIKVHTDGARVTPYRDLDPSECGFLGISFLCAESKEETLLKRIEEKKVKTELVNDDVYGHKVLLLRDPQNVPIRIAFTN
ncbi:glyoxalase, putative [Eimeria brunetti]|uniref:Glyoxalase, putative n=1 Tax=Eimeria brunetti TaxID=51314 RepID=U6LII7_9EIME|nr:glyoxalase, putative [Eimeria brunetti]